MAPLLVAAFLCLPACEKPTYPINYTFIEPNTGKPLEAEITGRTQSHVEFIRLKDSKFFSYPIDKLTADDQKFVARLRLESTEPPQLPKEEPAYIQTRLEHIARREQEVTRLELEIQQEQDNPGMIKHHQRQIADKKTEIEEFKNDIAQHRLDR